MSDPTAPIAHELGKPFAPTVVLRTDPGDLAGAGNPGAVDLIRAVEKERA